MSDKYYFKKPHKKYETSFKSHDEEEWWFDYKLHRIDGPAIEFADGSKMWYFNGKCHRLDGPAITHSDGYKEWYLEDLHISSIKDFFKIV